MKPKSFNGSKDYLFYQIQENDNYIVYEQRDKVTDRFVCYEVHKKYPNAKNEYYKSPYSLTRVNEIINTPKGNFRGT